MVDRYWVIVVEYRKEKREKEKKDERDTIDGHNGRRHSGVESENGEEKNWEIGRYGKRDKEYDKVLL